MSKLSKSIIIILLFSCTRLVKFTIAAFYEGRETKIKHKLKGLTYERPSLTVKFIKKRYLIIVLSLFL